VAWRREPGRGRQIGSSRWPGRDHPGWLRSWNTACRPRGTVRSTVSVQPPCGFGRAWLVWCDFARSWPLFTDLASAFSPDAGTMLSRIALAGTLSWLVAGLWLRSAGAGQFHVAEPDRAGAGQGEFESHGVGVGGDLRSDLVPGPVAAARDGLAGVPAVTPDRCRLAAGGAGNTGRSWLRSSAWVMVNRLSSAWPATSWAVISAARITVAPRYSPQRVRCGQWSWFSSAILPE
jgi:hypothetical protein